MDKLLVRQSKQPISYKTRLSLFELACELEPEPHPTLAFRTTPFHPSRRSDLLNRAALDIRVQRTPPPEFCSGVARVSGKIIASGSSHLVRRLADQGKKRRSEVMKSLYLKPVWYEGFDGGASARYPARREI